MTCHLVTKFPRQLPCDLAPDERDMSQVQTQLYTYEPQFNKIKRVVDQMGNVYSFIYDYEVNQGATTLALSEGEVGNLIEKQYPSVMNENGKLVTPTVRLPIMLKGR
ncbi:MAG: hypothetical protein B6242_04955 [Anaerolineaceae bacterium 4572_78]|nr:MAG: hypothetical protein B6242_04955 [Anaerolineaceae bacterium 4572_78]